MSNQLKDNLDKGYMPIEDRCAIDWAIDDIQKAIESLNKTIIYLCFPETRDLNAVRNRLIELRQNTQPSF